MKDYGHLVGRRFPGGRYELPEYLSWLWADAVQAEPDADMAHPALAYFVAMQGAGISIAEIFELFGARADSGVMFGEQTLEYTGMLRPGASYDVQGEITDVVRKEGKRAGVFDRVTFALELSEEGSGGEPVARSTSTWIFPRKDGE
jgi:hypothetical protein